MLHSVGELCMCVGERKRERERERFGQCICFEGQRSSFHGGVKHLHYGTNVDCFYQI